MKLVRVTIKREAMDRLLKGELVTAKVDGTPLFQLKLDAEVLALGKIAELGFLSRLAMTRCRNPQR